MAWFGLPLGFFFCSIAHSFCPDPFGTKFFPGPLGTGPDPFGPNFVPGPPGTKVFPGPFGTKVFPDWGQSFLQTSLTWG